MRKKKLQRETGDWPLYRAVSCEMGSKKRKKVQSTDTSDTFSTAEQRRSMEVSDSIMEKLKNIEEKNGQKPAVSDSEDRGGSGKTVIRGV